MGFLLFLPVEVVNMTMRTNPNLRICSQRSIDDRIEYCDSQFVHCICLYLNINLIIIMVCSVANCIYF